LWAPKLQWVLAYKGWGFLALFLLWRYIQWEWWYWLPVEPQHLYVLIVRQLEP